MKIYVPSADRSNDVRNGPLRQIPPGTSVSYVVPKDQMLAYAVTLADAKFTANVDVLGCDEQGIAATRHWIGRRAAKDGNEKFLCMDDDVNFIVRKSPEEWKLRRAEFADVRSMLYFVQDLLDEYAHVGIGTRQGNNNWGVGPLPLKVENTRTLRCLAYQTEAFLSVEHGRVPVMEDFDVNLQLLRKGLKNCSVNYWCQDQKMTNAPGGCSSYRTHALHESAARRLAELHPGLVSLRTKKNKTGGEFGERTEVTIQWKKSFGHG